MDHLTKEKRSWNMSRIRSKNTKPELIIRSYLHQHGFRFRLYGHTSKSEYQSGILPGKPDIVLKKFKTVIFINGCFWHGHINCKYANIPKTNTEYWKQKIEKNKKRDKENSKILNNFGWNIIVIWECEIKSDNFPSIMNNKIKEIIKNGKY